MYFHGFTVFPCILFLGLILGFPKQVQSLINYKFVDIKTKGWSRPSVCDLLSLRHLYRLSGTTLPAQTLFQQHGANVRISAAFKAKLFLVTRFSVYRVREPSLSATAATTAAFFQERQFCSCSVLPLVRIPLLNLGQFATSFPRGGRQPFFNPV